VCNHPFLLTQKYNPYLPNKDNFDESKDTDENFQEELINSSGKFKLLN